MDHKNAFERKGSLAIALLFFLLSLPAGSAAACGWSGDGEARAAAEAEVIVVGRDGRPLSDDARAETPSPARQTEPGGRPTERGKRHRDGAGTPPNDGEEPVER